jgi:hypothetical protein
MSRLPLSHPPLIGIPKPDNYFDYVHQRLLVTAIPVDKWKQHIQECVRVCASGGWIEIIEASGHIVNGGPACQRFVDWLVDAVKTRGADLNMAQNLEGLMREVGLINVTKQTFIAPFGPWGGRAGELFAENYRLGSIAFQPLLTNALGVPKEEIERNTDLMMEEFKSRQAYYNVHVYLGQKQ